MTSRFERNTITGDYSLFEAVATMTIVALLVGVAVLVYQPTTRFAATTACRENQYVLTRAIQYMKTQVGEPPSTLADLEPYVRDFDRIRYCPLTQSNGLRTELVLDRPTESVYCPDHPLE